MDDRKAYEEVGLALERAGEAYRTFVREFSDKVDGEGREEGQTRMQALEALMESLDDGTGASNLRFATGMVGTIDEEAVISSKGPSSSGAGSS